MEHVSLKLAPSLAREIDKALRDAHYSTKTEFIRDAIRAKLKAIEDERARAKAWDNLFALRGALKGHGKAKTDEEWRALKLKAWEEFNREREQRFSQNFL